MSEPNERLHPRLARRRQELVYEALSHLHRVEVLLQYLSDEQEKSKEPLAELSSVLRAAHHRYGQLSDEKIEPRRRLGPHRDRNSQPWPHHEYFLFLDECGHHSWHYDPAFPAFCICGVIVQRRYYQRFDGAWRRWKRENLGSDEVVVHEPRIRKRASWFYRENPSEQQQLLDSLDQILETLDYQVIAAVIHKERFKEQYPTGVVDQFLPAGQYLMALTFIMERFAHFLYHVGEHAVGHVVAESRGAKEDALVQLELTQLQLRGTQYMPSREFHYLISPSARFYSKKENHSGLQIADILARPVAEMVLGNSTEPERGGIALRRLYDGLQERPASYGLKCFPDNDLDGIFGRKANGDA